MENIEILMDMRLDEFWEDMTVEELEDVLEFVGEDLE